MAVIEKRDDSWRVQIRKKGQSIYKSFKDKETADLFVWYKEKLIDEMEAFALPDEQLFTLDDGFNLKLTAMNKAGTYSVKYFQDLHVDMNRLREFIPGDTYLSAITFDLLKEAFIKMSKTTVRKGGNQVEKRNKGGILSQISPRTLRRCLLTLSSIYSQLQTSGVAITNIVTAFTPFFLENFVKGRDEK